jgi:hypothetical protein
VVNPPPSPPLSSSILSTRVSGRSGAAEPCAAGRYPSVCASIVRRRTVYPHPLYAVAQCIRIRCTPAHSVSASVVRRRTVYAHPLYAGAQYIPACAVPIPLSASLGIVSMRVSGRSLIVPRPLMELRPVCLHLYIDASVWSVSYSAAPSYGAAPNLPAPLYRRECLVTLPVPPTPLYRRLVCLFWCRACAFGAAWSLLVSI